MSIAECIALLEQRNVSLEKGLTEVEIVDVENTYGFRFSPDHRQLLKAAQPTGEGWWNWSSDSEDSLMEALAWPLEGLLVGVEDGAFWPESWGKMPGSIDRRRAEATAHIETWPKLIPLYEHRYMPAWPALEGAPVFSVYKSDIIFYGRDLLEYLMQELGPMDPNYYQNRKFDPESCPPWSRLAVGRDPERIGP